MAENTRLKDLAADVKKLQDALALQDAQRAQRLLHLEQKLESLQRPTDSTRLDRLEQSLDVLSKSMDTVTRCLNRLSRQSAFAVFFPPVDTSRSSTTAMGSTSFKAAFIIFL